VERAGKVVRRYSLGLWLASLLLVSETVPAPFAGILVVLLASAMVEYER